MEHNEPREIAKRKYQNILRSIGTGIIIMSAWSVIKGISMMLIDPSSIYEGAVNVSGTESVAISDRTAVIMVICMTAVMIMTDILIRLYVGSSAIAIGMGRKRGAAYIILTCLLILLGAISLVLMIMSVRYYADDGTNISISAVVIELTSLIMLIEMLVASSRLKKINRQEGRNAA